MDEKRDTKALRSQHFQTIGTLRDVSREIRKSLGLRTGFGVSGELARVLRVEMAKAGRVLVHLVSAGDLQKPEHFQPWLSIALGFASLPREKVFEEVGCTISLPASMGEVDASSDDDLWAAANMFAHQDGYGGQDIDDHVMAALHRFVNRHTFLEAIARWLPAQIGLTPQDLSLLEWTIQPAVPKDRPVIKLLSDWHESYPVFSPYSGGADIASSCAAACDALRHTLRASGRGVRAASTDGAVEQGSTPQPTSGSEESSPHADAIDRSIGTIRQRIRDSRRAEIIITALQAARALQNEWVEGAQLKGLGISPSTLHHYSTKHWKQGLDYQRLEGKRRLYLRSSVIQYIESTWDPRPPKAANP